MTPESPLAIEDYALIGDCLTGALVGRNGSIDWLCLPRFDSDACFAALLGDSGNGRWKIAPAAGGRGIRRYREGTMILETRFQGEAGEVCVTDFMAAGGENSHIVRIVEGVRGRVPMRMECALRFNHGRTVPWVTRLEGERGVCAIAGPDQVVLRTPVAVHGHEYTTVAEFDANEGERLVFTLSHSPSHLPRPAAIDAAAAMADTERRWREFAARNTYRGQWTPFVDRSLLTLRALTYRPTGGIVAAPTSSLPEQIGGSRNWDYRFCWLRDATLTLFALMRAGYTEEAAAWRDWLHRAVAGSPAQIQILYGLLGERRIEEWEVDWLPGYEGSRPVRIGNAAAGQVQLDVFGEVQECLHQARRHRLAAASTAWDLQRGIVKHLAEIWMNPDEGMWEVRGGAKNFTFSKIMAWVALDRMIRDAEAFDLPGPVERWRALRREIFETVMRHGIDRERGCFVQEFGGHELDASLLLIPTVGFLPPNDPHVRATVQAVERELLDDGLVRRYRAGNQADGQHGEEGVFLACSFWLVDVYAMQGRAREAEALLERLLSLCNDVGLLSEEYDPRARRLVGNFPQAFSHVALVLSAMQLTEGGRRAAPPGEHAKAA